MKKKNKGLGIIILIIIIILLLFAVWFFLLKDKGETNNSKNNNNNTEEKAENKKDEPKENNTVEYDYKDGVLTQIIDEEGNPVVTEFTIDGIILVGNRHSYAGLEADTEGIIQKLVSQGYLKEGINSSFYLNEYIEFYIDTPYVGPLAKLDVFVVPYKPIEEYQNMSFKKILELANEKGFNLSIDNIDKDNYFYAGEGYVNMDYSEGKYDILFLYDQKIAYFLQIDLTKEPTEEQ